MDIRILLFLLYGTGLVFCYHTTIYKYHFINTAMTWSEAQQYCRQHYTDLATFQSLEDVNQTQRPEGSWIGLFDDTASWKGVMGNNSNSWRWSATGATSPGGYQNWASGQPDAAAGTQRCVTTQTGLWYDVPCSASHRFACFNGLIGPGMKNYTLISTAMTWEQARNHCRENYTDLAMIENESENAQVTALYPGVHLWTGLYREPWRWSDGRQRNFTNWHPDQPNNYKEKQFCTFEWVGYKWNDRPCSDKRTSICQEVFRTKSRNVQLKLQSTGNLSDPEVYSQIIEQVETELLLMGVTDFKLNWKTPPVPFSKEQNDSETSATCDND